MVSSLPLRTKGLEVAASHVAFCARKRFVERILGIGDLGFKAAKSTASVVAL